jgi:hypothetical protein
MNFWNAKAAQNGFMIFSLAFKYLTIFEKYFPSISIFVGCQVNLLFGNSKYVRERGLFYTDDANYTARNNQYLSLTTSFLSYHAKMTEENSVTQISGVAVLQTSMDYWKPLVGTVVDTDGSLTTLEVNCYPDETSSCSIYVGLPFSLTLGPSTQGRLRKPRTTSDYGKVYALSSTERCLIISSTQGALCETTVSEFWSSKGSTSTSIYSGTDYTEAAALTVARLAVSGREVVRSSETTTSSAKESLQTRDILTSNLINGTNRRDSKAWIAGPVLGALIGVTLIFGITIWYLRWRRSLSITSDNNHHGEQHVLADKIAETQAIRNPNLDSPAELQGHTIHEGP